MNRSRTAPNPALNTTGSTRLSALALASLLTLCTLMGVDTLARVDTAPAQMAQSLTHTPV